MHQPSHLFLLFLLTVALFGCKKEDDLPADPEPTYEFQVGSPNGMVVVDTFLTTLPDTASGSSFTYKQVILDMAGRGTADLVFTVTGFLNTGNYTCEVSADFAKAQFLDVFYDQEIRLCTYSDPQQNQYEIYYSTEVGHTCPPNGQDTLYNDRRISIPRIFSEGAAFPSDPGYWSYQPAKLVEDITFRDTLPGTFGTQLFREENRKVATELGNGDFRYLIFRLKDGTEERLGWLKFRHISNADIEIWGWAYEKK